MDMAAQQRYRCVDAAAASATAIRSALCRNPTTLPVSANCNPLAEIRGIRRERHDYLIGLT
jgi:hypothetical protein